MAFFFFSQRESPLCVFNSQPTLDLSLVLWLPYTSGLSSIGLCLAVPEKTVRWCTVSDLEASKCYSFHDNMKKVLSVDGPHVACVKRTSYRDCIRAIAVGHYCLRRVGENPYFLVLFLCLLYFIALEQFYPQRN